MAAEFKLRSYSYTFGSDQKGVQREFYSGGKAKFADIEYAINAGKTLLVQHDEEKLGYPASYSAFTYRSETNTLLVYTRCMRQVMAGRVTSCGQVVVYNLKDVLNGDDCLLGLFGLRFLNESEILKSTDMRHEQVVRANENYTPVKLSSLNEARKRTIAAVVSRLLGGHQVAIRLPVCKEYEALSLEVLQQVMALIPQRDRCEISFATACSESDVQTLRKVNLILTNMDEQKDSNAEWIDLDNPPELTAQDEIWLRWCNEEEDIRHDIEYSDFFTDMEKYSALVPRRNIADDKKYIEDFYNESFKWWLTNPEPKFSSLSELRKEIKDNPTLSVKRYRYEFLKHSRLQRMINVPDAVCLRKTGFFPSEEQQQKIRDNKLAVLLYDDIFLNKKTGKYRFEESNKQSDWNSAKAFAQFTDELTTPFFDTVETKPGVKEKKLAEGCLNGVTYAEMVDEITDRINNYFKNF